jgi:alpha-glucosidase
VFFFSSHDHPRQWSVFGDGKHNDQIAKLTAALTLTQRGTVLLYYGEELGMGTMAAAQLKSVPTGPKRPRSDDRDGERTPMQWDTGRNAGFSNGAPWLPVEKDYQSFNVSSEKQNGDSIYSWYSKLLKLRRENESLRDGDYLPLESGNRDVFAFGRMAGSKQVALIVLNTSSKAQAVRITGMPGAWPNFRNVLMASPPASVPPSANFTIAPYGVVILSHAN